MKSVIGMDKKTVKAVVLVRLKGRSSDPATLGVSGSHCGLVSLSGQRTGLLGGNLLS